MADLLKSIELRLLRCTIPSLPNPNLTVPTISLLEPLISSIELGDYSAALKSTAANLIFKFIALFEFENSFESADKFYSEIERCVDAFLDNGASDVWLSFADSNLDRNGDEDAEISDGEIDAEAKFGIVLGLGVAALLAFVQQNITGPVGDFSPFPVSFPRQKKNADIDGGGMWDMWARTQLTSVGCGLLGKFTHLQYIVYAKILLSKAKDMSVEGNSSCLISIKSIYWWLYRLLFLHQRILDELSSNIYDELQVFRKNTLNYFGKLEDVTNYWGSLLCQGDAATVVSMVHLEAAIVENKFCRDDSSRLLLERAEEACGMKHYITGVLGFRTINQVDAKAQQVLVPNIVDCNEKLTESSIAPKCFKSANNDVADSQEVSDILVRPKLVENVDGHNGKDVKLTATQQAVVLAYCLHLQKRSRNDELSMWEMAPYIEAIDGQQHSYYSIKYFCDILRVRWESTRSRTKERALLMMENLVEAINSSSPMIAQRIQNAFGVYLPTIPALRKEYGQLLVSCGMMGEALKIFEELELWDDLIVCYRLLDKKAAAVDLIKERLVHTPTDSKLWCSLGDVTNTDAYYEKALEVSNNKSARAKRSLARSAYNRGDYETSKILWESALSINSLFPDGWFAFGAAALKAHDFDKALEGFTRAVQLDPENGEAWNNVAFLHMKNKKYKPAFLAFKEALKFRRKTWQLWENFSHVAIEVGNLQQALEATSQVLELTNYRHVDVDVLETVMSAIETNSVNSSDDFNQSDPDTSSTRDREILLNMLGNILAQIVRNSSEADIWGIYARWHKIKGNLTICAEALLKQVRSYQGTDLWRDYDRFKKFANVSLQLCKVYMEIASSTGSSRELVQAEMLLRNSVKQAAAKFSDTKEFCDLQTCHEEIKNLLNSSS